MGVYEKARKETKERIIREFWKLYVKYPISKITVQQVADASHVHRSTVYFHFQDVYQILEAIEEQLIARIASIDASCGDSYDGLSDAGRLLFEEYRQNREYLRILVKEQRDHTFSARYRQEMVKLMVELARDPQNSMGKHSALQKSLVRITASVIIETFLQCADDEAISYEDTMKIMQGFMLQGFYKTLSGTFRIEGMRNPV